MQQRVGQQPLGGNRALLLLMLLPVAPSHVGCRTHTAVRCSTTRLAA